LGVGGGIGISNLPILRTLGLIALTLFLANSTEFFFGKCIVCSLPFTWKVKLLSVQFITAHVVFRKYIPIIIDKLSSSAISNITKFVGICTLAIMIETSSHLPIKIAVDLSAI
jgi:hypothetical protein